MLSLLITNLYNSAWVISIEEILEMWSNGSDLLLPKNIEARIHQVHFFPSAFIAWFMKSFFYDVLRRSFLFSSKGLTAIADATRIKFNFLFCREASMDQYQQFLVWDPIVMMGKLAIAYYSHYRVIDLQKSPEQETLQNNRWCRNPWLKR